VSIPRSEFGVASVMRTSITRPIASGAPFHVNDAKVRGAPGEAPLVRALLDEDSLDRPNEPFVPGSLRALLLVC